MPGVLPQMEFKESDFAELAATMTALPRALAVKVQGQAFAAGARILVREAKARVSVRTGRLRETIRVRRQQAFVDVGRGNYVTVSGGFVSVVTGGLSARQSYLVEAGHGGPKPAPAHPFLGPAIQDKDEEVAFKVAEVAGRKMAAAIAEAKRATAGGAV